MSGRIINGIKYMYINDCNDFKKKSLCDNVYFTLRDIFWNANSVDDCMQANNYNSLLTNNICFEERIDSFQYTNMLNEKDKLKKLLKWLNKIEEKGWFVFLELEDGEEIIEEEYIKFHDWWKQFVDLRRLLTNQYENNFEVK
jgi:hypothetical protein